MDGEQSAAAPAAPSDQGGEIADATVVADAAMASVAASSSEIVSSEIASSTADVTPNRKGDDSGDASCAAAGSEAAAVDSSAVEDAPAVPGNGTEVDVVPHASQESAGSVADEVNQSADKHDGTADASLQSAAVQMRKEDAKLGSEKNDEAASPLPTSGAAAGDKAQESGKEIDSSASGAAPSTTEVDGAQETGKGDKAQNAAKEADSGAFGMAASTTEGDEARGTATEKDSGAFGTAASATEGGKAQEAVKEKDSGALRTAASATEGGEAQETVKEEGSGISGAAASTTNVTEIANPSSGRTESVQPGVGESPAEKAAPPSEEADQKALTAALTTALTEAIASKVPAAEDAEKTGQDGPAVGHGDDAKNKSEATAASEGKEVNAVVDANEPLPRVAARSKGEKWNALKNSSMWTFPPAPSGEAPDGSTRLRVFDGSVEVLGVDVSETCIVFGSSLKAAHVADGTHDSVKSQHAALLYYPATTTGDAADRKSIDAYFRVQPINGEVRISSPAAHAGIVAAIRSEKRQLPRQPVSEAVLSVGADACLLDRQRCCFQLARSQVVFFVDLLLPGDTPSADSAASADATAGGTASAGPDSAVTGCKRASEDEQESGPLEGRQLGKKKEESEKDNASTAKPTPRFEARGAPPASSRRMRGWSRSAERKDRKRSRSRGKRRHSSSPELGSPPRRSRSRRKGRSRSAKRTATAKSTKARRSKSARRPAGRARSRSRRRSKSKARKGRSKSHSKRRAKSKSRRRSKSKARKFAKSKSTKPAKSRSRSAQKRGKSPRRKPLPSPSPIKKSKKASARSPQRKSPAKKASRKSRSKSPKKSSKIAKVTQKARKRASPSVSSVSSESSSCRISVPRCASVVTPPRASMSASSPSPPPRPKAAAESSVVPAASSRQAPVKPLLPGTKMTAAKSAPARPRPRSPLRTPSPRKALTKPPPLQSSPERRASPKRPSGVRESKDIQSSAKDKERSRGDGASYAQITATQRPAWRSPKRRQALKEPEAFRAAPPATTAKAAPAPKKDKKNKRKEAVSTGGDGKKAKKKKRNNGEMAQEKEKPPTKRSKVAKSGYPEGAISAQPRSREGAEVTPLSSDDNRRARPKAKARNVTARGVRPPVARGALAERLAQTQKEFLRLLMGAKAKQLEHLRTRLRSGQKTVAATAARLAAVASGHTRSAGLTTRRMRLPGSASLAHEQARRALVGGSSAAHRTTRMMASPPTLPVQVAQTYSPPEVTQARSTSAAAMPEQEVGLSHATTAPAAGPAASTATPTPQSHPEAVPAVGSAESTAKATAASGAKEASKTQIKETLQSVLKQHEEKVAEQKRKLAEAIAKKQQLRAPATAKAGQPQTEQIVAAPSTSQDEAVQPSQPDAEQGEAATSLQSEVAQPPLPTPPVQTPDPAAAACSSSSSDLSDSSDDDVEVAGSTPAPPPKNPAKTLLQTVARAAKETAASKGGKTAKAAHGAVVGAPAGTTRKLKQRSAMVSVTQTAEDPVVVLDD
eukprot:TRINITY_DN26598_c0_g1_i1.p1 TRINITY_DN26598_c0_g1~~TRINITY_DN26598_c0_g1_i1.p1  ORF type:complete len:1503 (-),score=343.51 TRINITY_DN26598_c0_g1_i1:67-4575(-)